MTPELQTRLLLTAIAVLSTLVLMAALVTGRIWIFGASASAPSAAPREAAR